MSDSGPGGEQSFKLVRQSEAQWEIEYVPREHGFTTISIDGKNFIRFVEPTLTTVKENSPACLRYHGSSLSRNTAGASISVELENPGYQVIENTDIDTPSYDLSEEVNQWRSSGQIHAPMQQHVFARSPVRSSAAVCASPATCGNNPFAPLSVQSSHANIAQASSRNTSCPSPGEKTAPSKSIASSILISKRHTNPSSELRSGKELAGKRNQAHAL